MCRCVASVVGKISCAGVSVSREKSRTSKLGHLYLLSHSVINKYKCILHSSPPPPSICTFVMIRCKRSPFDLFLRCG